MAAEICQTSVNLYLLTIWCVQAYSYNMHNSCCMMSAVRLSVCHDPADCINTATRIVKILSRPMANHVSF